MRQIVFLFASSLLVVNMLILPGLVIAAQDKTPQPSELNTRLSAVETLVADLQTTNRALTTRVSALETQVAQITTTDTDRRPTSTTTPRPTLPATSTPTRTPQAPTSQAATGATNSLLTSVLNRAMVGDAQLLLPKPEKDFDVIILQREASRLSLFVRNNTQQTVKHISVDAIARAADGSLLAVTSTIGFRPAIVRPSEVTFATLSFRDVDLPEDAVLEFDVNSAPANVDENAGDLEVTEHNLLQNRFVGMLSNPSTEQITGPIEVTVLCFDTNGEYLTRYSDFTPKDQVSSGESIAFQVNVRNTCPTYLLYASGFVF